MANENKIPESAKALLDNVADDWNAAVTESIKTRQEHDDAVLRNARDSLQLNMQRLGRLGSALPDLNSLQPKLEGGLRRGEMILNGVAVGKSLHPAWEGIGAVTDREDALNRLEQLGKNSASGMFYVDEETKRSFQLPALLHNKSQLMFDIVIKNNILREIYANAVVLNWEMDSNHMLYNFMEATIDDRNKAKAEILGGYPQLTHFQVGNGVSVLPLSTDAILSAKHHDPSLGGRVFFDIEQGSDGLTDVQRASRKHLPEQRTKKPKRHGDKQSTSVIKVRPSGLLKGLMGKIK